MNTVTVNLSKMFAGLDPWDCSNSAVNMGPHAGTLTWENCERVVESSVTWCITHPHIIADEMSELAKSWGAFSDEEIDQMSQADLLALFVQTVAGELRNATNVDDVGVEDCWGASDAFYHIVHMTSAAESNGERIADIYLGS